MEENKNITYPKFISNKPCGVDKFEGKSQERLTNAIANHIVSNDNDNNTQNLSRIIGLEGGWGVGKSNVIKQLKKHDKIKDGYYIFEYDAWGHQEDLQRRSFLEIITTELIEDKILSGYTEISIKGFGTKKVSWQEKLKYLLARKTEISTEKRPKLSIGIVAFIIATIFTSIAVSIADTIKNDFFVLSILLPFIPFLIAAIVLWILLRKRKNWKEIFNEIFSIYSGKIENEVSFETISEEEPTVMEFKNWMQDISDNLGKENKKIIIVYDNMDRLPSEKVKELWSSIHTFFSEDGFENIWAIIPYDEKHLSCAFGESEDKEQLTKYFISKTFPIVYRVTPPVITDFKNIFNVLFEEAFGNTDAENQDNINRIFRLEKPDATVREIIEYINQLVALKSIWKDEIDLLYIAIYKLKKGEILKIPIEQILSGEYLGKYIPNIVANDEVLQKNISALTYGVSIYDAEQIPMSKYLDSCFNLESNTDINKFACSSKFFHILSDKVNGSDTAQLDNIVICLSQLELSTISKENLRTITSLWNTLSQRKMTSPFPKQEFNKIYKSLIQNTDESHKHNIIKYLCNQIQSFQEFNSENYFKALNELDDYIKADNIDINDYLADLEKEPEVFVDYVLSAKDNYALYNLSVNPTDLYKYLSDRIPDKHSVLGILKYLINDQNFQFNIVKVKIEETIKNEQLIKEDNFKPLFDAYKILSEEKPLSVQLNPTQCQNLWNTLASKPNISEFLEIIAIQIAVGTNIETNLNNEQIKYIAENLDYYASYGELLIKNLSWNIPLLNQVLEYMTTNKLGYMLSLEDVLPSFFEIKENLNITEQVLLEQLNDWEEHKNSITSSNIKQLLPNAKFFQFSKTTNNALTDFLNKTIIEALSTIQSNQLYQFLKQQPSHYWIIVINNLIDTDFLKSLPDNLTELGKLYLDDIAASRSTIPNANDIVYKIIDKLDGRKTAALIKDIRDKYCNSQYIINSQLFLYFESRFEKQGDLKQSADRVTHKIIEPVINDTDCLNRIIAKSDFYSEIVNEAGDDATALKDIIKIKIRNSNDDNLISFAKKIGVEKDSQENY